jgi:pyruvate,water dikinase
MWWLADLASQLGDRDLHRSDAPEDLNLKLKESNKGLVWIDEFNIFLEKFGRRTTAALFDPYYKTWLEDPYPALSTIRTYVQKGGFDYEDHTRKIIEERDKYIEETVAKITDPDAR